MNTLEEKDMISNLYQSVAKNVQAATACVCVIDVDDH